MASTKEMESFLEEHRHKYEPVQHWNARRQFMVNNWDRYSGNQLVSLSMVWSNIEFDGATYPPALMARVKEMGQGIALDDETTSVVGNQSITPKSTPMLTSVDLKLTDCKESGKRSCEANENPRKKKKSKKTNRYQSANEPGITGYDYDDWLEQEDSNNPSVNGKNPPPMSEYNRVISTLASNLRKQNTNNRSGSALNKLHNAGLQLSLRPEVEFVEVPPPNLPYNRRGRGKSPLANPMWICNLSMGDTLLASVKANNKPNSKTAAAEMAVLILESSRFSVQKCTKRSRSRRYYSKEVVPSDECFNTQSFPVNHHNKCGAPPPTGTMEKFVLTEPVRPIPSTSILINSAQSNHVPILFETSDNVQMVDGKSGFVCTTIINGVIIDIGLHMNKREARNVSANNALATLRKTCPTLKKNIDGAQASAINRDKLSSKPAPPKKSSVIEDTNVGHKMLKMMGWTGGALAKDGIVEPIEASEKFTREGFGYRLSVPKNSTNKIDMKAVRKILMDFVSSGRRDDLIFTSELSQEERKAIHLTCRRFNLKSQSYGKERARYLVVTQKRNFSELVQDVAKSGGTCGQYELVSPETQVNMY